MGHPPCCFWDTPPVSVSDFARPRHRPALRPRNGPEDGAPSDRHLGRGQPDGGPDREAVNRPSRGRLGGRAVREVLQPLKTIRRLLPSAGRAQQFTVAACRSPSSKPGDFLADVRVGLGRPGRVRRALAVAVLASSVSGRARRVPRRQTPVPTATTCTAKVRARSAAQSGAWATPHARSSLSVDCPASTYTNVAARASMAIGSFSAK